MEALSDMGSATKHDHSAYLSHRVERPFDLVDLHAKDPIHYPHLLQSSAHGRFDILFAHPGDSLTLKPSGGLSGPADLQPATNDFLENLDRWWSALQTETGTTDSLPFTGGWFLYLGYELAGQIEPRLQLPRPEGLLPVAVATRFFSAIVHDHKWQVTTIVAEAGYEDLIRQIANDIAGLPVSPENDEENVRPEKITEAPPGQYLRAIARILEYIREGDVFQVNLSRRWDVSAQVPVDVPLLYKKLRQHNPSPYSGIARWKDAAIISSSPERLVRVQGKTVETRPVAGTRPRSCTQSTDIAYSRELLAHPKERAEHIMLIDLERNDLGKICVPGSVQVDEFMVLESCTHVHHIVSNIKGRLRHDVKPGQVIRAVFPGGTITGCPKVRCMEIIAELEQDARDAYTGSMGYLNRDGSMDLNILIRSMVTSGNTVQFRAGAGIVADSVPAAELEETRAKALGMMRAVGMEQTTRRCR
jgi:anthranilate synthase component 1